MFARVFLIVFALARVCAATHAADFKPTAFFSKHCTECHDAETKKGNLDLTRSRRNDGGDSEIGIDLATEFGDLIEVGFGVQMILPFVLR